MREGEGRKGEGEGGRGGKEREGKRGRGREGRGVKGRGWHLMVQNIAMFAFQYLSSGPLPTKHARTYIHSKRQTHIHTASTITSTRPLIFNSRPPPPTKYNPTCFAQWRRPISKLKRFLVRAITVRAQDGRSKFSAQPPLATVVW